ncbi:MAG: DNA recombination protein RmuC [Alphaproteobacteria bacterium]|nr:MAG: DNA recombination protein RmuC [Alphaproteobacteria bacterium]
MNLLWLLMAVGGGMALGGLAVGLWLRARLAVAEQQAGRVVPLEAQCAQIQQTAQASALRVAELEATQKELRAAAQERQLWTERLQQTLPDTFKALAGEALRANSEQVAEMARLRVTEPLAQSLNKLESQIQDMEKARAGAYQGLHQTVQSLLRETGQLGNALRMPQMRGRWGEMQLQRILEMSGMSRHANDFETQVHVQGGEGDGRLRPDVVVHLPGGRMIVIDAKTPLDAYVESLAAEQDSAKREALTRHARQVKNHIQSLSAKSYWTQFSPSPDFVVMFMPGDHFLSAALEEDPDLVEHAFARSVLIATPLVLLALLRAAAYGWRQESLATEAMEIARLGRDLHALLTKLYQSLGKNGQHLGKVVEDHNSLVGWLERRLLPGARRLAQMHGEESPEAPDALAVMPRALTMAADEGEDEGPQREAS